jgi:hypothetical protein
MSGSAHHEGVGEGESHDDIEGGAMKRLVVVCALFAASVTLTSAPPVAATGSRSDGVVTAGVMPMLACDGYPRITKPLRDMEGFRLVESRCGYKEWLLRGTTSGQATGRSVANYYVGQVRTAAYALDGGLRCRRRGSDTVCTQYIQLRPFRSTCTSGAVVVRVGPIRSDGRRPGSARIFLGTGC